MPQERLEKSVRAFWLTTCGYDIGWRNANLADTPWNEFNRKRDVLVSTLWVREIVPLTDPLDGRVRRFIRLGDVRADWTGPMKSKGKTARENIDAALKDKLRFVGFEVAPKPGLEKWKVKHFFLDRAYELEWLPALRADHDRLKISEGFAKRGIDIPAAAGNLEGVYFELVPLRGPIPGSLVEDAPVKELADPSCGDVHKPVPTPAPTTGTGSEAGASVDPEPPISEERECSGGWGGGESLSHKVLKEFVAANPAMFGLPEGTRAIQEFGLRSGDSIDVVFETDKAWIAVEVKSKVSNLVAGDYERGIFQVVKYRAVLEAQAAWDRPKTPRKVRVLLALEGRLPEGLRQLAQHCRCDVVERVEPHM